MTTFAYRKSSYSTPDHECVEVALNVPGTVAVRDSKEPERPGIRTSPAAWGAFLHRMRSA
ncbi:DUF397 domain-containing protein [Streptomyces sp. ODS28]|uniref:DUF397 domain-containing protein n=1 Tax=Streptomyces sp. ODS28 TaxID=3136688 RepID=UPI0031E8623A